MKLFDRKYAKIKNVSPDKITALMSNEWKSKTTKKNTHVTVKILKDPDLATYNAVVGIEINTHVRYPPNPEGNISFIDTYVLVKKGDHHVWIQYKHTANDDRSKRTEKDIAYGSGGFRVALHKGVMNGTQVKTLLKLINTVDNQIYKAIIALYKM
ncbi:hypothetical protein HOK51_04810 [Candidatus Woesearchaeota archaeon]|jgi:hypothetical protein|nr:hypothetical protein [Candidatus Woesearchaeota archaeon]MBT6519146.1 hypothetical protein [Candidatus Woesearchaeota archaeon]MBT7367803.1 hypothetical protein [Candidatus Woesearchaeota archaeon]